MANTVPRDLHSVWGSGELYLLLLRSFGNQRVKNISRPIRVWQWTPDASLHSPELPKAAQQQQV
ncbi:hypothetical protein ACC728_39365, partial [Rhizobium ruizarguesonis]